MSRPHLITHLLTVLTTGLLLYGCNNYQAGYQDGYAKKAEKNWVIFNRTGYKQGYLAGQAEVFQAEWITENTYEDDGLQCREIIVKVNPLMFLPSGYHEATTGIYEIKE